MAIMSELIMFKPNGSPVLINDVTAKVLFNVGGSIISSTGIAAVEQLGVGRYLVSFTKVKLNDAYGVIVQETGSDVPCFINVYQRAIDSFVIVSKNIQGNLVDMTTPFVVVF